MKKFLLFILLLPLFLSAQVQYDKAAEDSSTESERIKQSIPKHLKKGKPQKYKYNDLWGYILNDSILIPCKYYSLDAPYSDVMVCREPRGLYGAINKKGELVIPYGYNLLEKTEDGLLWGWKTDNGYGLMTLANKILVPFDYKNSNKRDSFYIFSSPNKQLIVRHLGDEKMEVILEGDFEEISYFNPKKHPQLAVKQKGLWGLMDYNKHIVVPCEYDLIQSIGINKTVVSKGGKTGIVDFEGKVLLPFNYDELYDQLRNGLIPVANKDATGKKRVGLVDSIGQVLLPVEYEQIEQFYNCELMKVKKEGKWGIVDMKGKLLSDIQFNDISDWKHIETIESIDQKGVLKLTSKDAYGLYFVHKYDNTGKVGLWNLEKGQILPPEYDYFEIDQLKGQIKVSLGEKRGIYNMEGKQLIGFE
jgi:WG containing repeat